MLIKNVRHGRCYRWGRGFKSLPLTFEWRVNAFVSSLSNEIDVSRQFQTEHSERKRCLLSRCSSFSGWRRRSLDWKMIIMFIVSTRMRRIRTLQSIDIKHHWRGWTKQKCIQRPPLQHKNKYFLILLQGCARNGSTKWICLLARSVSDPPTFELI